MPTIPQKVSLEKDPVKVLNSIRNDIGGNFERDVPEVKAGDILSLRGYGTAILGVQDPYYKNAFLDALTNRVAFTIVTSKTYQNHWWMFKKGKINLGEVVQEIFVNMATPHNYDPLEAETNWMKRELPDVRAAYYHLNYQKYYKVSISDVELEQAFLSWSGITSLVADIIQSLYTAMNADEFLAMRYMLARTLVDGYVRPQSILDVNKENMADNMITVIGLSNDLEIMPTTEYNPAGVYNYTMKDDQYLLVTSEFAATMNVAVLATAFNMDKAEFMGHIVTMPKLNNLDTARLEQLLGNDPSYRELTEEELSELGTVPAVVVDRNFFMVFDKLLRMEKQRNGESMYYQNWLHTWKWIYWSPYSNATAFVIGTPAVNSVTVTPDTVTAPAGSTVQLNVAVQTTAFAPKTVTWSVDNNVNVTVDKNGLVTVNAGATGTATIKATSTFDPKRSGTCTLTVGGAG